MRSSILHLLLCLLAALAVSSCGSNSTPEEVVVGRKAPDFSLKSLDGKTVKGRSYTENVVILNFWATWCQPCKKEIPELKAVAATTQAKVVGIALDQDQPAQVKSFAERIGINYTVLLGNDAVFKRFNGFSIPYTLVLDQQQQIVNIYRGPTTRESLEQDLKKINQSAI